MEMLLNLCLEIDARRQVLSIPQKGFRIQQCAENIACFAVSDSTLPTLPAGVESEFGSGFISFTTGRSERKMPSTSERATSSCKRFGRVSPRLVQFPELCE